MKLNTRGRTLIKLVEGTYFSYPYFYALCSRAQGGNYPLKYEILALAKNNSTKEQAMKSKLWMMIDKPMFDKQTAENEFANLIKKN